MDCLRAFAKGTFREFPYKKPLFALAKQAEDRYPGQKPENIRKRHELNRRLGTEYQALKALIIDSNQGVESKTEISRLKIHALTTQLNGLILRDVFVQRSEKTAILIERCKAADPDEKERELALSELAEVALAAGSRKHLDSLAKEWGDEADMLLKHILAHKAAVHAIQEKYFDGHAILYHSIEDALEATIEVILEAVATFNEYVSTKTNGLNRAFEAGGQSKTGAPPATTGEQRTCALRVDVEAARAMSQCLVAYILVKWVTEARDGAIADMLKETGEHEEFIWQRFREKCGVQP